MALTLLGRAVQEEPVTVAVDFDLADRASTPDSPTARSPSPDTPSPPARPPAAG